MLLHFFYRINLNTKFSQRVCRSVASKRFVRTTNIKWLLYKLRSFSRSKFLSWFWGKWDRFWDVADLTLILINKITGEWFLYATFDAGLAWHNYDCISFISVDPDIIDLVDPALPGTVYTIESGKSQATGLYVFMRHQTR